MSNFITFNLILYIIYHLKHYDFLNYFINHFILNFYNNQNFLIFSTHNHHDFKFKHNINQSIIINHE